MPDDLRDRIAAVMEAHDVNSGCGCHGLITNWFDHMADAVIEALGMQVGASALFLVDGKKVIHNRYTTEWVADE